MPKKPRFYLPGIPAHIVQRGNCRHATFFDDEDYTAILHWLNVIGDRPRFLLKHANFPKEYDKFTGAWHYLEWLFEYRPEIIAPHSQLPILPPKPPGPSLLNNQPR